MDTVNKCIETMRGWLRQPDHDEVFTLADAVNWVEKRPISEFECIAASIPDDAQSSQVRNAAIEECAALIESGAGMADLIEQDDLDQQAKYVRALAAQPPAAPVGMTYNTIKAAFDDYCKTLTVMDTRPSFDSFSQGYVAGWNAKETQPHNGSSADNVREALAGLYPVMDVLEAFRGEKTILRISGLVGDTQDVGIANIEDVQKALGTAVKVLEALRDEPQGVRK